LLLRYCEIAWKFVVQKIVDATEKHSRRYGYEALDPLQYETGRNTQENREPVSAALKKGNSRNDTPISFLFHTNSLRRAVLRRHVLLPRRKNDIYGSQQDRVRHPRRAIQIAGEIPKRDAELQSCRNVAHLGDYVLKNSLSGGRRQVVNLNGARVSVCTIPYISVTC
ncbi:MAG TPA: hypothetical protein VFT23_11845, partial [Burkholderiales bacterium]|nr:hypothetical protein [Burkholderiales bacterium]